MEESTYLKAQEIKDVLGGIDTCINQVRAEMKIQPEIKSLFIVCENLLKLRDNIYEQNINYEQSCAVLSNIISSLKRLITDINSEQITTKQQVIRLVHKRIDEFLNDDI